MLNTMKQVLQEQAESPEEEEEADDDSEEDDEDGSGGTPEGEAFSAGMHRACPTSSFHVACDKM